MHVVEAHGDLVVVAIVAKKIDRYCKKFVFFVIFYLTYSIYLI